MKHIKVTINNLKNKNISYYKNFSYIIINIIIIFLLFLIIKMLLIFY